MTDLADYISGDDVPTLATRGVMMEMIRVTLHDMMNSIASIKMTGEVVGYKPDRYNSLELWDKLAPHADQLEQRVQALRTINTNLLNKSAYKSEIFELAELMDIVLANLQPLIANKNLTIIPPTPLVKTTVFADIQAIRAGVISALISNAIRFSNENSEIIIDLEEIDDFLKFTVSDNGIGLPDISPDELLNGEQRESFRRRCTEGELGTGFGLWAANAIAKHFGGIIEIGNNDTGRGTRVSFSLPIQSTD